MVRQHEDDRSIPQLFADLTRETAELLRKEIELAKLEITENFSELKKGVLNVAIALPVLYAGFLFLLMSVVLLVDRFVQLPWLSTLIVGGCVTVAGLAALFNGRHKVKQADLVPHESVESLRDDKQMLQRHLSST
jgi:hypothetical protein